MTVTNTLDIELKSRADAGEKDAMSFWHKFNVMKEYLKDEYYPWIQSSCPYYTDHGEAHVESVIQSASLLLGERLSSKRDNHLSSLEIFIMLSAILWHDAGMVYGRSDHAARFAQVTDKIKEVCLSDLAIYKIVADIAKSHSGQGGLKIPTLEEDWTTPNQLACTIYPKALAAVMRFVDEISENRSRISSAILPMVPDDQKIYWEYANCVTAARPDPARNRIVLSLTIPFQKAIQQFVCKEFRGLGANTGRISLIEYLVRRIEKMNNERAYCAPVFSRYVLISEILVRFKMTNGALNLDEYETEKSFGEPSPIVPSINIFEQFFDENPKWKPDQLKRKQKPFRSGSFFDKYILSAFR